MNILLTGGAGYIGSHTAIVLSEAGHEVVLFDNFSNSKKNILERLQKILGKFIPYVDGDVRDKNLVIKTLKNYKIEAVIHFAGLKAVGESVLNPVLYYSNNVVGSISLIDAMLNVGLKSLIFSSSATVYGNPEFLPIDESHPTNPTNPYGRTKLHIEETLKDLAKSDASWKVVCLRYFNPIGAHKSALIGEDPNGIPNNLMPYIAQVASQDLPQLNIYGKDYSTHDGTGVRDYIHVMDIASGHLAAVNYLHKAKGWDAINLGTGRGYSVLDLVKAFEHAAGIRVPFKYLDRRSGDISICYAKVEKANDLLNWRAINSIDEMCSSSWEWWRYKLANIS